MTSDHAFTAIAVVLAGSYLLYKARLKLKSLRRASRTKGASHLGSPLTAIGSGSPTAGIRKTGGSCGGGGCGCGKG